MSWQKRGPNQGTIPHVENQFTHFQWFTAASNSRITHSTATLRPRTAPASIQQRPPFHLPQRRSYAVTPNSRRAVKLSPVERSPSWSAALPRRFYSRNASTKSVAGSFWPTPPYTPATDTPSTLVPKWNRRRKHAPPSPSQFPVSNFRPTQSG